MNNTKIRISRNFLSIHELDAQGSPFESLELEERRASVVTERGSRPEGNSTVQLQKLIAGSRTCDEILLGTQPCQRGVCIQRYRDRFRSIVRDLYGV
jgi:hypothetical protein